MLKDIAEGFVFAILVQRIMTEGFQEGIGGCGIMIYASGYFKFKNKYMTQKQIEKYPNTCYSCKFRSSYKTHFGTRHYCKAQRGQTKYHIKHIKGIMMINECNLYKTIEI